MASVAKKKSSEKKNYSKADLKKKIQVLKEEKKRIQQDESDKSISTLRRRIHRLKRQVRKVAAVDAIAKKENTEEAGSETVAETPKPEEGGAEG